MAPPAMIHSGYRLRDLTAGFVVIQTAVAFVYAILTDPTGAALVTPAIVFGVGLALAAVAFGGGWLVDQVAARVPALIRPRRCPPTLLVGLPALAIAWALQEESLVTMVAGLCDAAPARDLVGWIFA